MTTITTVETVTIPTGEYLAQVVDITGEQGNFGPQFRWKFDILKPDDYSEKSLVGWTSTSPSLKGKFVKWATACLGRTIRAGESIDTDELIGAKVVLTVTVKEGDDGSEFNKVESVKAYRKTKPAPPPEPVGDDDEDPFGDE